MRPRLEEIKEEMEGK
ncbi:hypothetical protein A2U01_0096917, partial [Trifolium medium]|nr:hypothetical protein [Trifolium medium]